MATVNKKCTLCEQYKFLNGFYNDKNAKDGKYSCCKICHNKYYRRPYYYAHRKQECEKNKKWKLKNPEKFYRINANSCYKRRYGITIDDYEIMFEKQQGCCAICNRHQSEFSKALHVDHNHNTKRVRGLLCKNCNMRMGWLEKRWGLIHTYLGERK